jgi:TM2 domain-containing membrane protein YozV
VKGEAGATDKAWVSSLRDQRTVSPKNWLVVALLSIFLGILGIDRFYSGRHDLGILKLLTLGGFCIWWAVDVILVLTGCMKDGWGNTIRR